MRRKGYSCNIPRSHLDVLLRCLDEFNLEIWAENKVSEVRGCSIVIIFVVKQGGFAVFNLLKTQVVESK